MYRYKIIKTTAKTDEIPYTEKSFSLYWEESRKLTPTVKDLLFLACVAFCAVTFEPIMI